MDLKVPPTGAWVGGLMVLHFKGWSQRIQRTFSSLRTGIVLLITLGVVSAAGTFVLQRPLTDAERLERAYAPETLRWLDRLSLTDVFHSWWFALLLAALGLNIILASLKRFPVAWAYVQRRYARPDAHFLKGLTLQREIQIPGKEIGLAAAERAFRQLRFKPQRVASQDGMSLFAERNRFVRLAAYLVHASLLLIFAGAIADALLGYRGYVALTPNRQTNLVELSNGKMRTLPFVVRCDDAGQENYADGSPRRWWSKLVVLDSGREVLRKEIAVNDPLVFRGVRFYQSGYGSSGDLGALRLRVVPKANPADTREIVLHPNETLALDAENSVRVAAFFPDFVIRGKQVETRSDQPNNPAIQLTVDSKKSGATKLWLFANFPEVNHADESPFSFQLRDLQMGWFTGLQVSHEPGQWAVWIGVVLMMVGLAAAFYFIHTRVWAVPISDDRGRLVLWVGASASKNREEFEERFSKLVAEILDGLKAPYGSRGTVSRTSGSHHFLVNAAAALKGRS